MYWFGIGLELLSACLVAEVCQASRVFLMRKGPLSMTLELSLFTAIPVDKACNYISSKLLKDDKLSSRTSLDSNKKSFYFCTYLTTTTEVKPRVWKRYADDSFCIIKRNAVNSFHTTLNSIDPHISFTIE